MNNESTTETSLRKLCATYARPLRGRATWQLLNSAIPFVLLWAFMAQTVLWGWNYGWTLLLVISSEPSASMPAASAEASPAVLVE